LVWLLSEKVNKLMSDQDTLNTFVANLNTALSAIGSEIAALKAQIAANPPPVAIDFTGADAALAAAVALEPPAPAGP
jgi:hypothetical protein